MCEDNKKAYKVSCLIFESYDGALHGNQKYISLLMQATRSNNQVSMDVTLIVPAERELYIHLQGKEAVQSLRKEGRKKTTLISQVYHLKPHVILCNNQRSLIASSFSALVSKTPLVWYIKDFRRFFMVDFFCFLMAKKILVISPQSVEVKGDWVSKWFGKKIFHLPIGIPLEKFTFIPMPSYKEKKLSVLMLSAIVPAKGIEVALDAMTYVNVENIEVALRIAGASSEKHLGFANEMLARSKNIDGVEWLGWQENIPALLQDADVVILPSFSEGVPRSLVEAMAAGRLVVASRIGGIASLIEDGVTGMLIDAGDARGLAEALIELAHDPDKRQKMGKAARKYAVNNHDFSKHLSLLEEHLKAVVN